MFNVIAFLAGFIIVVAVVIVLQLDCMLGTSTLFLALLLLFRIVVNTKVGSDFNLSKNAKHAIVKRQNVDKESTDEVQFLCVNDV